MPLLAFDLVKRYNKKGLEQIKLVVKQPKI